MARRTNPIPSCEFISNQSNGEVAERLKAPVLKTGMLERALWVRIPPFPPRANHRIYHGEYTIPSVETVATVGSGTGAGTAGAAAGGAARLAS